jgi:hypothetical protein
MIRKSIVFAILVSMALHCGCRLGLLDQLFRKRHEIAFALGLIEEIPIALCSSSHDFSQGLKIAVLDDSQSISFAAQTREIDLYLVSCCEPPSRQDEVVASDTEAVSSDLYKLTWVSSIFHPPSFSS